MSTKKREGFFSGTLILMGSGIAVKVIGALFSVPLANLYGADGNDLFISAYYVYTALYVISSAGLPVAVSKLVSEARAKGRPGEVRRIARVTLAAFVALGLALSAGMWLLAGPLCRLVGSGCRYALLAISPAVFFTCVVSALRGYFQGLSDMVPTAVSQIVEALGKLIFGLGLARYLMDRGYSLEVVVAGAVTGVTLGTAFSAVYMVACAVRRREKAPLPAGETPVLPLLKKLFWLAVPITVGASVFSVSSLLDTFMVKLRLQEGCYMTTGAAGYLYGVYGFAVKLFNLPLSLASAIGVSLIPAISGALAVGGKEKARRLMESAFRLTGILAFPCAAGLAALPLPVLRLLFGSQGEACALAAPLLRLLAPAVFLAAMVSVTNPVLQSAGRPGFPVASMALGAAVKMGCNYLLVGIPEIGIAGAPVGTCLCYLTILLLNLRKIGALGLKIRLGRAFFRPLVSAAAMGLFAALLYPPLADRLSGGWNGLFPTGLTVALSAVFYLLMLAATRALPREDLIMAPKGEKLVNFLKIK